jgi:hypothetical protein
MRELPILFSGPLVRALLAGTKTQTRRLLKPQLPEIRPGYGRVGLYEARAAKTNPFWADFPEREWLVSGSVGEARQAMGGTLPRWMCPYGTAGDRLWVRETWRSVGWRPENGHLIEYAADGAKRWCEAPEDVLSVDVYDEAHPDRWRPSVFLFRWASRLTLEVTSIRVQRLQDISEDDARAEGITWEPGTPWTCSEARGTTSAYRSLFADLWDRINGKRDGASWDANPWVWAVTFRRVPA